MSHGERPAPDRRTMLRLLGGGTVVAIAGCGGDGGDGDGGGGDGDGDGLGDTPGGDDQVPQEYATATALGGSERDPGALSSKQAVDYQDQPNEGEQCSGCTFYIEDKNGDGMGACSIVEGQIAPEGWCSSYSPFEGGDGNETGNDTSGTNTSGTNESETNTTS